MSVKAFESKFKVKYDWFKNSLQITTVPGYSSSVLSARLRKLDDYFEVLTEAYEGILSSYSEDSAVIASYDAQYKEATEAYNKLEAVAAAYPNLDGTHMTTESNSSSRLPRINLTTFDGDVFSWSSFISLFTSLVLSRRDISKTEKFHYLFSNVQKEPQSLIKHLPMVDGSLDVAMDILKGRYENKRLQADSHISRILHLPVLTKSLSLRTNVLNPLLESTRALKNLGLPTDEWSYILLHISLTKLPINIKTRFEQQYGGNNLNLPTFDQLTEFLQNECRLIDTASAEPVLSYAEHTRKPARAVHAAERPTNDNQYQKSQWVSNRNNYRSGNNNNCVYCQLSGHNIGNCFKFTNMSNYSRKDWVKNNGLCFRCFEKHPAAQCSRQVPCNECGNVGHNKLICTMPIARSDSAAEHRQHTRHAMHAQHDNDSANGRQSPGAFGRGRRRSDSGDGNKVGSRMRELLDAYECENEPCHVGDRNERSERKNRDRYFTAGRSQSSSGNRRPHSQQ